MFRLFPWRGQTHDGPKMAKYPVNFANVSGTTDELLDMWDVISSALLTRRAMLREWIRVRHANSVESTLGIEEFKLAGAEFAAFALRWERANKAMAQNDLEAQEAGHIFADPSREIKLIDDLLAHMQLQFNNKMVKLTENTNDYISHQLDLIADNYREEGLTESETG